MWYSKIDAYFHESGLLKSENEPTLHLNKWSIIDIIILCLYVEDIIYVKINPTLVGEFKLDMMRKSRMIDLRLLKYFLGLKILQVEDGIFIC